MMRRIPATAIRSALPAIKHLAAKQAPAAVATALIGLKIDGHPVQVAKGATLLDAINKSNSHVPTLCYHPEFEPRAMCECTSLVSFEGILQAHSAHALRSGRMCLVDLTGEKKPVPACRTKAEEGQEIVTNSEDLKSFRRR